MLTVQAPVCVHHLSHLIMTNPGGIRPRPVTDGSAEMRAVLVTVVVHDNGNRLTLHPSSLVVCDHMPENADPEKPIPVGPEQEAAFVFHVRLPAGYKIVHESEIKPQEIVADGPAAAELVTWTRGPEGIPELAGLDPAVFETRPEVVNEGLREVYKKGKPNPAGEAP